MVRVRESFAGRVGERLKPADCKSAAPCGLRRFESFPVHQAFDCGVGNSAGQSHAAMFKSVVIRGRSGRMRREKCFGDVSRVKRARTPGADSAWVAQLVERVLGKDEVTGSIPVPGSRS